MIQRIKLSNWKCHRDAEFVFRPGTNVIVGAMGAGKSSILQAISFGLFGTFSELKKRELNISDVINRAGAQAADIELELLTPDGRQLLINKQILADKGTYEATLRSKDGALLAGPNPRAVTDYVQDALKINEDLFLRTVYARQNEIDLFLRLPPVERKKRIDELMGLDKFELVRKNAIKLTNQIKYKKVTKEEFLGGIDVGALNKEISSLKAQSQSLISQKSQLAGKLKKALITQNSTETKLKALRTKAEIIARLEERKELYLTEIQQLNQRLKGKVLKGSQLALLAKLDQVKGQITRIQAGKENLKDKLETKSGSHLELEKAAAAFLEKKRESSSCLKEIAKAKSELKGYAKLHEVFDRTSRALEEKSTVLQASMIELDSIKKHLIGIETAEGVCPVCSRQLTESTKRKLVAEKRKNILAIQSKMADLNPEVDRLKKRLTELEQARERHQEQLIKIKSEPQLKQSQRATVVRLDKINKKRSVLSVDIHSLQGKIHNAEKQLEKLGQQYNELSEQKSWYEWKARKDQLDTSLLKLNQHLLKSAIDKKELLTTESLFQTQLKRAQQLETQQSSLTLLLEEKGIRLKDLKSKKNQVAQMQCDIKAFERKIEFLNRFKNALLIAQEALRKDLILAVNEVMALIWQSLYPYDLWASVRLLAHENDYILQLKEPERDWVAVAGFASGGERMLACLATRIAFAKVLAPNLSLLILDEPTHNLDERAIKTLIDVLKEKISGFLDQTFIITHDETLAEAADNIIKLKIV